MIEIKEGRNYIEVVIEDNEGAYVIHFALNCNFKKPNGRWCLFEMYNIGMFGNVGVENWTTSSLSLSNRSELALVLKVENQSNEVTCSLSS